MTGQTQSDLRPPTDIEIEELKKIYGWKKAFKTWWSRADAKENEKKLLSTLEFFPGGDSIRNCELLDVDIGNKQHIHEFSIQNIESCSRDYCKDLVMVHGYGAALGLFVRNFDGLSRIPGINLHALDMLGCGLSSRPRFPGTGLISSVIKRGRVTKEEVYEAENFFIDSLEKWRQQRKLDKFVLVGHSLGGYLSCCYALKFPERVEKLVLVSPVGVEKSVFDLTKEHTPSHNNASELGPDLSKEVTNSSGRPTTDDPVKTSSSFHVPDEAGNVERVPNMPWIFSSMWTYNISPFGLLRSAGPAGPLLSSRWSFRRFSFAENTEQLLTFHEYCYSIFSGSGSGEYALTRILAPGVLARVPLLSRVPENLKCDSFWMYGSHDWMSKEAGSVIVRQINKTKGSVKADYSVVSDAGHHLYLDNPEEFNQKLAKFLKVDL
ncbi:KLTH0C01254p [Lachancea thermotolerans CBS 6340]|uniref:KLTH0C01254p n=1 Tax=Lachancea thermotolerans (strain ATCC 56472 / CBS 6340 / NRRL Y-8284) TaxID=559295 RepID=C5DDI5_LACTC|nr:KLTH0C01254p [Lachancea thermotolerans CBS 6340]CAR21846.1 KLTH0C01254p [Lachancea thermotolerans CBS 6340]